MLIITKMHEKNLALLLKENKLLAVLVLPSEAQQEHIGDIYMGRVSQVLPQNDCIFVEYQKGRIGFLSYSDAVKQSPKPKVGDHLAVMVKKEAVKQKTVTLTTKLTMNSPYFSFSVDEPQVLVSKKLTVQEKEHYRTLLTEQGEPCQACVIIRTRALVLTDEAFLRQYRRQKECFEELCRKCGHADFFQPLHLENGLSELLCDQFSAEEMAEIVTDDPECYRMLLQENETEMLTAKLRLYEDERVSLVQCYQLEKHLQEALQKKVYLKSGGNLVIDVNETLTVIDVNAGKGFAADKRKSPEEHSLSINREAAAEIARQIRLRNLTGMILIDFINMKQKESEEELLQYMRELTGDDRQKVTVLDVTMLGLMELTRQKGLKPLHEILR